VKDDELLRVDDASGDQGTFESGCPRDDVSLGAEGSREREPRAHWIAVSQVLVRFSQVLVRFFELREAFPSRHPRRLAADMA